MLPTTTDLENEALDVIEWLETDGQSAFCIDEAYAGYPTDVNAERVAMAAESLSCAIDDGKVPGSCPPVNAAIIAEVYRILAKRERWIAEYEAAREAAKTDHAREAVESAERVRRAAELRIRDARRAETYRAILHPDSGASPSERQQAQSHLSSWSNT
jgi:hypothetical protein